MMSKTECRKLTISGRVQGVFYRASARDKARELGLTGWVRNRPDGAVEALACGPGEQLEAFADWCRTGPPHARVSDVTTEPADQAPDTVDFRVVN